MQSRRCSNTSRPPGGARCPPALRGLTVLSSQSPVVFCFVFALFCFCFLYLDPPLATLSLILKLPQVSTLVRLARDSSLADEIPGVPGLCAPSAGYPQLAGASIPGSGPGQWTSIAAPGKSEGPTTQRSHAAKPLKSLPLWSLGHKEKQHSCSN